MTFLLFRVVIVFSNIVAEMKIKKSYLELVALGIFRVCAYI